jgi:serine/threonine protein kinase
MDPRSLCPGCFGDKEARHVCPRCGYDESTRRSSLYLPHRTLLQQKYLMGRALGTPGGFGVTYLALDTVLQSRVAIKEYFPRDFSSRDTDRLTLRPNSHNDADIFETGLRGFLEEARTLSRFHHPNIVRIRDFFTANGTAYLVMDYRPGESLMEELERRGALSEKEALAIILPILEGLRTVHEEGLLHRDIKPHNIFLVKEKGRVSPILLDFGAARFALGERSRSLSVVLTPGFAPYEQYHRNGRQGPWTDIYACAATLYFMLSGQVPPDAAERLDQDALRPLRSLKSGISATLERAVMSGLALRSEHRPQTVQAFTALLAGGHEEKSHRKEPPMPYPSGPKVNLYAQAWKKYADFTGRACRKEFWLFQLPGIALQTTWLFLLYDGLGSDTGQALFNLLSFFYPLYSLLAFLPSLAVSVRRMHDTDHSGWWLWVPFANLILAFFVEGSRGDNRYGPDPKALADAAPPRPNPDHQENPGPVHPKKWLLIGRSGEYRGQEVEIPQEGITLGRDPRRSHLILSDPSISRAHARVWLSGDQVLLEDLQSTTGTFRSSPAPGGHMTVRLERAERLSDGDAFFLGPDHQHHFEVRRR